MLFLHLVANGNRVMIESGAGIGANFKDKTYSEAGAEVTKDSAKVYSPALLFLKLNHLH